MINTPHRSRFAPSPSGTLHIGNLRSALMSFLCAKETNGTFILRIEDTDQTRTDEKFLLQIYHFLEVMNLYPDEGPLQSGPHAPYIQSTRQLIYQKYLALFESKNLIYRCFQSEEELEKQRKKQTELKLPPRYTRKIISQKEEAELINQNRPFVWRLALPKKQVTIFDKVKQNLTFDLAHFADIPLTRHDGTFTFLFANFVDDVEMKINYVVRGEEHLSNTAIQAYMYEAIGISLPVFYHLPLICDSHGKKLSKRDFGFNIQDLLNAGFLPEAILNYLIIIGGSFKEEIFSLDEAIAKKVFSENKSAGMITYDQKKLLWINKKWMQKISKEKFIQYLNLHEDKLVKNTGFVLALKNEAATLKEIRDAVLAIEDMHSAIRIDFDAVIFSFFTDTLIPFLEKEEGEFFEWKKVKKVVDEFAIKNNLLAIKLYKLIRYICIQKEEGISLSLLLEHIPSTKIIIKLKKIMESI